MKRVSGKKSNTTVYMAIGIVAIAAGILIASVFLPPGADQAGLKKFNSAEEVAAFLKTRSEEGASGFFGFGETAAFQWSVSSQQEVFGGAAERGVSGREMAEDYSTTNIQVRGVDEADIVKNDGKYIYTVTDGNVVIVDAFPPEGARIASTINLTEQDPQELYVNGDRLVVFGTYYGSSKELRGFTSYSPTSYVKVYDVADRSNPVLKKEILFNGTYFNSRMIGDYVYAIVTTPTYYVGDDYVVPVFSSVQRDFPEIYYFDVPDVSYTFTNIVSLNVKDDSADVKSKIFLMGASTDMFVSLNNIYLVYRKQMSLTEIFDRLVDEIFLPIAPEDVKAEIQKIRSSDLSARVKVLGIGEAIGKWQQRMGPEETQKLQEQLQEKSEKLQREFAKELEKSIVHKIAIDGGNINYKAKGEVPGYPLNQFSMDEDRGYFRIATTTGTWSRDSANHLYVLDENMNIVGKLEDLAPGERIFSARFIGERAYMVTFIRVDPLFVIDLSDPRNPRVLGELKIPGVSDYLHPYDENHVIGVGRNTEDIERWVTFTGLKISLFDVSDMANPKEVAKYEIGERGTDSEVLRDHKAFLFSKQRSLLVIPVLLTETKPTNQTGRFVYPEYAWQGAYVFRLTPEEGFVLKGRVTHADADAKKEDYYHYSPFSIKRSLYMENFLYTISSRLVKANDLDDLDEVSEVKLPASERRFRRLIE